MKKQTNKTNKTNKTKIIKKTKQKKKQQKYLGGEIYFEVVSFSSYGIQNVALIVLC